MCRCARACACVCVCVCPGGGVLMRLRETLTASPSSFASAYFAFSTSLLSSITCRTVDRESPVSGRVPRHRACAGRLAADRRSSSQAKPRLVLAVRFPEQLERLVSVPERLCTQPSQPRLPPSPRRRGWDSRGRRVSPGSASTATSASGAELVTAPPCPPQPCRTRHARPRAPPPKAALSHGPQAFSAPPPPAARLAKPGRTRKDSE